jgi:hypothetical protein
MLAASSAATADDHDLQLLHTGVGLQAVHRQDAFDAVVVIGNYAFDSFPMDMFVQTAAGGLLEVGVCARSGARAEPEFCARRWHPQAGPILDARYGMPMSEFFASQRRNFCAGLGVHSGGCSCIASSSAGSGAASCSCAYPGGAYTVPTGGIELLTVSVC